MRRRTSAALLCILLLAALTTTVGSAVAQSVCDPMQTRPEFAGTTPTGRDVLGFDIGQKEVTSAESDRYLEAVDRTSDRVVTGTLGFSVQNRPLKYAIVSTPENVAARDDIAADMQALRDPSTPADAAAEIVSSSPNILWIASNVHGGEESGTDASLRVLYELADRTDCAAQQILENSLVVLLPIQNPDGREADTRRNYYGFDMNRDWFARTQPETDSKIEFIKRYPPVLFIDAHEMGSKTYFFPPNSDPIYHEITDESIDWINNVYGAALAAEFERQRIPYFNRSVYDLFYMGYGDTVPSTGFISAGMTFEKASGDPIHVRTYEQYVTQWVSLSQGAILRERLLTEWRSAWAEAHQQGVDGLLEPNEIINPGNELVTQVPTDPVRHYFIRSDDPDKEREVAALIERLQRMEVEVYRLAEPLTVDDYKPYGRARRSETLPAGTYWIPMAQMQKHWVQAMLNEDTYTPFPYFYDVTGWSNPLLFNVAGGYSGAELEPVAAPAGPVSAPAWPQPADVPEIALWEISSSTSTIESAGWTRYMLEEVWDLPYRIITTDEIASGGLANFDVLLAPNGSRSEAIKRLQKKGRDALVAWVNSGGTYIGWRGGTRVAAGIGLTTATLSPSNAGIPGSLVRAHVDEGSPLAAGVGPFAYAFWEFDDLMDAPASNVVIRFPTYGTEDFFISGFAEGESELGGTVAAVDEAVGEGRVVLFTFDPNFRAFTDGTQKILWNAMVGAEPQARAALRAGSEVRADEEGTARAAAARLSDLQRPIRLTVGGASEDVAWRLLARFDATYEVARDRGRVSFAIANPGGLSFDEHPWARDLVAALRSSNARVVMFSTP